MKIINSEPGKPGKQVTYTINVDPDGPSDADFRIAAEYYANHRFRKTVKDSAWRRFLAVFGLYNEPNEKAHHKPFHA